MLLIAVIAPASAQLSLPELRTAANKLVPEIQGLQGQLQEQLTQKNTYQANLNVHQKSDDWSDSVLNFFVDDRRTKFLNSRIKQTDANISSLHAAIESRSAQYESNVREISIRTIKANSELLAAETTVRNLAAIEAVADYETQRQQITAGELAFDLRIAELDSAIAERSAQGLTDVAVQFTQDRELTIEAHEAWRERANSELDSHLNQRRHLFNENREDGIGPTNGGMVNTIIRQAARAGGETIPDDVRGSLIAG